MIMKHIKAIFAAFCLLGCVCCTKSNSGEEPLLEVNRNNISGEWELVEWNGNSLEEGTFFRINLVATALSLRKPRTVLSLQSL